MPFVLDSFLSDDPAYVNSLQSFTTLDEVATSATSLEEIKLFAQELCELVQQSSAPINPSLFLALMMQKLNLQATRYLLKKLVS